MKNIIKLTEDDLRAAIKQCINEKMRWNPEKKQYFPKYTGDPHRDAGKYADNDRDMGNYSRNFYNWSDPKKGERFNQLQWKNHTYNDPFDDDKENQGNAEEYLDNRRGDYIVQDAIKDMKPVFIKILISFIHEAKKKYPILKKREYQEDFLEKVVNISEEELYDFLPFNEE
jgi:hypothetical protein